LAIALLALPEPPEWQRVGDQIDAAFVFARADFVNVHFLRDKLEDFRLKSLRNKL
jgi:hypothetical protein